jgi:hypothetical protein
MWSSQTLGDFCKCSSLKESQTALTEPPSITASLAQPRQSSPESVDADCLGQGSAPAVPSSPLAQLPQAGGKWEVSP